MKSLTNISPGNLFIFIFLDNGMEIMQMEETFYGEKRNVVTKISTNHTKSKVKKNKVKKL